MNHKFHKLTRIIFVFLLVKPESKTAGPSVFLPNFFESQILTIGRPSLHGGMSQRIDGRRKIPFSAFKPVVVQST